MTRPQPHTVEARRAGRVVLVHGAWHGAWCWDGVVAALDRLGVASEAVELPLTGLADDAHVVRAAMEAAGPDVVVVGHSFGGLVITAAAAGVPFPPKRLIYLAAFMTPTADDVGNLMVGHHAALLDALVFTDGAALPDPAKAAELFFGDADESVAAAAIARLRPQVMDLSVEGDAPAAWRTVPTTYIVCTNDRALPPAAQEEMAANATEIVRWPTDHSPFLTRPQDIADVIARYC